MATSVLPQLLEVDSQLSAQTASLEAQLAALQEKRKGIQTVISMFEAGGGSEAAADTKSRSTAKKTQTKSKATKKKPSATKAPKATKTPKAIAENSASESKSAKTRTRKVKATKGKITKGKSSKTSAVTKKSGVKRSGRTANWQKYIQESYSKTALPEVIVGVLKDKPDNIFKIADVMNAVFKEDMPKTHFLKARNRVSNILSAGARDGSWYRGRNGTYSVSEKAIKSVG